MLDDCVTTDAAVDLLKEHGLLTETMTILGENIENTLKRHVLPDIIIGYVCFKDDEILMQSYNAKVIISGLQAV
jgi:cobalt-precorrin-5B (C1)-methyltransferase